MALIAALLIGRQVTEIGGAHIQARGVVRLIDQIQDALLLGDDRVRR